MMSFYKVFVLLLNSALVSFVAGQSVLDKDVEIISGKNHPPNPLDAKFIGQYGQYGNDIYGPPVSVSNFKMCV